MSSTKAPGRTVQERQSPKRAWRWPLVGFAGLLVAAVVFGVVVRSGGDNAVGVVEEYIDTFNNGDIEATLAFLLNEGGDFKTTTDPEGTPFELNGYQNVTRLVAWQVATRLRMIDPQCAVVDVDMPNVIRCDVLIEDVTKIVMGYPTLEGSLTATVEDGRLSSYLATAVLGENSSDIYLEWLEQAHPEAVAAAGDLIWSSVEDAVLAGSTRARYVDEWAASRSSDG